jgi:hypothetical protein
MTLLSSKLLSSRSGKLSAFGKQTPSFAHWGIWNNFSKSKLSRNDNNVDAIPQTGVGLEVNELTDNWEIMEESMQVLHLISHLDNHHGRKEYPRTNVGHLLNMSTLSTDVLYLCSSAIEHVDLRESK